MNCSPVSLGAEWFHTYVFGHAFTIESDHKPLKQINIRNLADTPVHLQRMLLQLQNYVTIRYWPDKEMLVADAVFHYAPLKAPEIPLDITINHVHITPDRIPEFQTLIKDDLLLCFPCWDDYHRMATWFQWCPICSMPIPWPQKHPNS